MERGRLVYEGKAKSLYEHPEDENLLVMEFRDDITAFNMEKMDTVEGKGVYNCLISARLFEVLEDAGIPTHYVELADERRMVVERLDMFNLEVICRNMATGSLVERLPFEEGEKLDPPIVEFDYKSDEYGDPMVNMDHIRALGLATEEEVERMRELTLQVNEVLSEFLKDCDIILVDFKLEFGVNPDGEVVVGDEISPDTCRFWDAETEESLDKDIFRKDEGDVLAGYREAAERILRGDEEKLAMLPG
ncbi:phosphoribosylaminoimidazolesuccinocarboxamide synthase [Methanopyrus kandleri]|uniref:Phosphoribosylaminoimidazole-succinocarboxamide synthase n=2 Tax=Methanopyrus kandleri TaxID=2320 RepID=PUR7_METKA|nr:phosphoribosylaminoimidazolesuccinocarboxamide synthase [Methanopyrus kandleri]Q8TX83.1 RecName: Full=Phosphoribosylaminoimidazole-succinocarboxamide synthase; AltName: Full=SAICAR synthetase [Methanopyrus kandleri AV19]AAM02006.1 Phosphoribosylaminoimidazolesuccinocarboxamide (SAICAR) synthase [Methanopyrus kandleri AV19]HII69979.1 phosphoribosylaminoimidazolesuccinocarboxamide synthase [Methanopyrus kandleri]